MLSNIEGTELSSVSALSFPVIYVDTMNTFLSADSLQLDSEDLDNSIDVEQYLQLDDEGESNRIATNNSHLTISSHESISRRSSDEGSNANLMSISPALTSPYSVDTGEKDLTLATVRSVDCDDFPYEDVLSLESALVAAVGDEIGQAIESQHNQLKDFQVEAQFFQQKENVTTDTTPSQLAMVLERIEVSSPSKSQTFSYTTSNSTSSSYHSNVSSSTVIGVTSKISHRVALTPKSTVVLSDDVLRKKHRSISFTNVSSQRSAEGTAGKNESCGSTTLSSRFTEASSPSKFFDEKQQGSGTLQDSNISVGCSLHKKAMVQDKTLNFTSQNSVSTTKQLDATVRSDCCHIYTTKYSKAYMSEKECLDIASSTDSQVCSPESSATQIPQKHPLPPEGYKITRYPLMSPSANVHSSEDEKKVNDQSILIGEMRHQLRLARMEIAQHIKKVEDWKSTAQCTFEAARTIRAQMELERSRADRAESRIAQLTSHFRSKMMQKASGLLSTKQEEKKTPYAKKGSLKKRSKSETRIDSPSTSSSVKRRRMTTEASNISLNLASWLLSSSSTFRANDKPSCSSSSSRSPPDNILNLATSKDDLVHTPQVNSCVRLALRAKVCSARGDTLKTAQDLLRQTKLLIADLPTVPEASQNISKPLSNLAKIRNVQSQTNTCSTYSCETYSGEDSRTTTYSQTR